MSTAGWVVSVVALFILAAVAINIVLEKGDREVTAILAQADAEKGTDADLLTIARGTGVDRTPDSGSLRTGEAVFWAVAGALALMALLCGCGLAVLG